METRIGNEKGGIRRQPPSPEGRRVRGPPLGQRLRVSSGPIPRGVLGASTRGPSLGPSRGSSTPFETSGENRGDAEGTLKTMCAANVSSMSGVWKKISGGGAPAGGRRHRPPLPGPPWVRKSPPPPPAPVPPENPGITKGHWEGGVVGLNNQRNKEKVSETPRALLFHRRRRRPGHPRPPHGASCKGRWPRGSPVAGNTRGSHWERSVGGLIEVTSLEPV